MASIKRCRIFHPLEAGAKERKNYEGIYYQEKPSRLKPLKKEKIFYIYSRIDGKLCEEKVKSKLLDANKVKAVLKLLAAMKLEDEKGKKLTEADLQKLAEAEVYLRERQGGSILSPGERRQEAIAAANKKVWTILIGFGRNTAAIAA